ncbi:phosphotransferase [Streptomyces tendae]
MASAAEEPLLSHTSQLWRIDLPYGPAGEHAAFVFKAQLNTAAIRSPEFHGLKRRIMEICAGHGIPVPLAVPAVDGSAVVRQDGVDCELAPMLPGTAHRSLTPGQADGVTATGLALRSALDRLPDSMVAALRAHPVNPLVEEERWQVALDDALGRLLPLAGNRTDEWGRLIAAVLRQLQRCKPLLDQFAAMEAGAARDVSVVHGDLHRHHFLFDDAREDRITAVLDFDNLRLGDRLLDLAWIAGTAGQAPGDRRVVDALRVRPRPAGHPGLDPERAERLFLDYFQRHDDTLLQAVADFETRTGRTHPGLREIVVRAERNLADYRAFPRLLDALLLEPLSFRLADVDKESS